MKVKLSIAFLVSFFTLTFSSIESCYVGLGCCSTLAEECHEESCECSDEIHEQESDTE